MKEAISLYDDVFQYVTERLQDNEDIVDLIIETEPSSFVFASGRLKCDKNRVLKVLEKDGNLLFKLQHFLNDKEVIKTALKQNGTVFNLINTREFLEDKELALTAIEQNSGVLYLRSFENHRNALDNDIMSIVASKDICTLSDEFERVDSDDVRNLKLKTFVAHLSTKPQNYFLTAIKNTIEKKIKQKTSIVEGSSKDIFFRLFLNHCSVKTLIEVKKVTINLNREFKSVLDTEIKKKELLELKQDSSLLNGDKKHRKLKP